MANRRDYFYRQLVTEAELDAGFEELEKADRFLAADQDYGVVANATVVEHSPGADLTVDVSGSAIAYNQAGERIAIPSLQVVDMSVDTGATSTAVVTPGNEKWVSLFLKFKRVLSDSRLDGNSNTVFFVRDESFEFVKTQGAEAGLGAAVRPALTADTILLADIQRLNPQTQILNANISTTRRQDVLPFNTTAGYTPRTIIRGRHKDAISDLLTYQNQHYTGAANRHATSAIDGAAVAQAPTALGAELLSLQIVALLTAVNARAIKAGETITGPWTFADITATSTNRYKLASRLITRTVRSIPFGLPQSADRFQPTTAGRFQQLTANSSQLFIRLDLPDGAVLQSVAVWIDPPAGHGALPAAMPNWTAERYTIATDTGATWIATQVDASAGVAAYEPLHAITASALALPVDNTQYVYTLQIAGESGANAIAGLQVKGVIVTYTVTNVDDGF